MSPAILCTFDSIAHRVIIPSASFCRRVGSAAIDMAMVLHGHVELVARSGCIA